MQSVDPDNLILNADFLPLAEAVSRLQAIRWRAMREPMISYLSGEAGPGSLWIYRAQDQGDDRLMARLPAIDLPSSANARHFSAHGAG